MPAIEIFFNLNKSFRNLDKLGTILDKRLPKQAAGIEKSLPKAIGRATAFSMAKMNIILGLVKGMVLKAAGAFPEIGKTLSFAGNVISRNLLWPLRQELMPILNKFLRWVTANRTEFVKWGRVLANVFRALVAGIKTILKPFKDTFDQITAWFKRMLQVEDITEGFNIILHRIVAVFSVMQHILAGIFDFIKTNVLEPFFRGFSSNFEDLKKSIARLGDSFKFLSGQVSTLVGDGKALQTIFENLGGAFAFGLTTVIATLGSLISTLGMAVVVASEAYDVLANGKSWAEAGINIKLKGGEWLDLLKQQGSIVVQSAKGIGNATKKREAQEQSVNEQAVSVMKQKEIIKNNKDVLPGTTNIIQQSGQRQPERKAANPALEQLRQQKTTTIPGKAEGGDVVAGQPYIVGEKRPELFVPREFGSIIPDLKNLGSKTISNVFNISVVSNNAETAGEQIINELKRYADQMGQPGVFA